MSFIIVPQKRKEPCECDVIQCIICDGTSGVVQKPKEESYVTLRHAADRRKDVVAERYQVLYDPCSDKQTFSWHRECYGNYVNESKIVRREKELTRHEERPVDVDQICDRAHDILSSTEQRHCRSSTKLVNLKSDCIICKKDRYKQERGTFVMTDPEKIARFISVARHKLDNVFTEISTYCTVEGIISKNLHYHATCLRNYLYIPKENPKDTGRPISKDPKVIETAFKMMLSKINLHNRAFELSTLTNILNDCIEDKNIQIINKDMKNILINKYGNSVLFSYPMEKSKSPSVVVADVSADNLLERLRQLSDPQREIQEVTQKLRNEIDSMEIDLSKFVCDDRVIEQYLNEFKLPPTWYYFLEQLLQSKKSFKDTKLRRAKSIFMDLCYTIKGMHSPKHIALAQGIHYLTRSKVIITLLSRLGHCISYSDLRSHDTYVLKKIVNDQNLTSIKNPCNIVQNPSLPLRGVIDNKDFLEETMSGKGTTHVTTMILIQRSSLHCHDLVRLILSTV
ncbi:hypothetical protein QAD02_004998 [Eretmocerus hayati]|uniref:Uncharacterized protein n=1 Tax=Eretmocerus hayati TaxID=131215 RepID=A0ACC2NT11_9HYME|nr:hypothetical protein QAD02_004998 [Eretmocerus hayati]